MRRWRGSMAVVGIEGVFGWALNAAGGTAGPSGDMDCLDSYSKRAVLSVAFSHSFSPMPVFCRHLLCHPVCTRPREILP